MISCLKLETIGYFVAQITVRIWDIDHALIIYAVIVHKLSQTRYNYVVHMLFDNVVALGVYLLLRILFYDCFHDICISVVCLLYFHCKLMHLSHGD